jgi:hypothetical protein
VRPPALIPLLLLAGCGGDDPRVDGVVDGGGSVTTSAAAVAFTGRVSPPGSAVRVSEGTVRVEPSGRFTVAVASPRSGAKRIAVEGTRAGHRPWRATVSVARGRPERVRVPGRDVEAPTAALLVETSPAGAPLVLGSPSQAGDRPDVVALPRPSFRATGPAAPGGSASASRP